ncbi:MAG TPA: 6-carboxytetrahydropterin synthase QueD [Longimicrobiales bacterium]|nr:6-carboxytetrahydropterin synthase QueD [Longimicrobiales bacterium]
MFVVSAQAHYDAAHFLRNYPGKCRHLHGHRYVVEAAVAAEELNEAGIAFDFVDLKRELRELADALDHTCLNDLPQFQGVETSAENQARYFFEELQKRLPPELAQGLRYCRIWETPTNWAMYGPAAHLAPAARTPTLAEGG